MNNYITTDKMTVEQKRISKINWLKAREHFGIENETNMVLHHVLPCWRHFNIERYTQWNPEDLVVMGISEHLRWHHKGKTLSEKHKKRLSEVHRNKIVSEEARKNISEAHIGIQFSEEHRHNISNARKGKHFYNNGIENRLAFECPEGFTEGKLKKN